MAIIREKMREKQSNRSYPEEKCVKEMKKNWRCLGLRVCISATGFCTSLRLLKSREREARTKKKLSKIREMCKCIYPGWPAPYMNSWWIEYIAERRECRHSFLCICSCLARVSANDEGWTKWNRKIHVQSNTGNETPASKQTISYARSPCQKNRD